MKKVLIIAYGFPPMSYAGVFRTLKFCKYLPQFDWQPLVLTIKDTPYHHKNYSLLEQLPTNVTVYRTSTIDPARWYSHRARLKKSKINMYSQKSSEDSVKGNVIFKSGVSKKIRKFLFNLVSFPDHMIFWIPFAVIAGIKIVRKEKPDVIYVSSPPHSSHLIGLILSKLFGKPWIADFRDPLVDNEYIVQLSQSKIQMKINVWLEAVIIRQATCVLLNTTSNRNTMLKRYHSLDQNKLITLTNGFDEDDVKDIVAEENQKFTITFLGSFYPYFKTDLFLDGLKLWIEKAGASTVLHRFQVLFIGGKNPEVESMIHKRNLSDIIHCVGYMPKKEAMRMCLASHLLLLILGFNKDSERIVPSKIFDYFLCKKPILAIAPEGEMEKLIRESKTGYIVTENKPGHIEKIIDDNYREFIAGRKVNYSPDWDVIEQYSARFLSKTLASIFNDAI